MRGQRPPPPHAWLHDIDGCCVWIDHASPECVACDFALRFISILLLTKAEGLGCAVDQFPKRDRPKTSPLSSSQQPMDHVFYGVTRHQKVDGRSFHSQDSAQQFLSPQAAAFRDGFFWSSMIVSARANRCFSRRFSRRESASSAASGFGSAVWDRAWRGLARRRRRGALTPPVRQRRRVKPLAAHDRADRSGDAARGRPPQGCATCLAP